MSSQTATYTDIVSSFKKAIAKEENVFSDGFINWNFVDADMNLELGTFYSSDYLYECLNVMADEYHWLMTGEVA